MGDNEQKSCWGVTAKAVLAFGLIMGLAWLAKGTEAAAVLASAG